MLIYNGKISLYCFLASLMICLLLILPRITPSGSCILDHVSWILPSYYIIINVFLLLCFRGYDFQVAIRAAFIGFIFSVGLFLADLAPPSYHVFGWYMCFMSFFHYSEFLMIALTNPRTLSLDSFILNHSIEYGVAAFASWVEFFIERWIFPDLKELTTVSLVGVLLCVGGELLRKLAMFTAKTNFNHIVQSVHEEGHQLVTHGVYKYCRHPSYVGWFYWSIGTQLILVNPVCTVAYTVASWRFFHDRVFIEENTLLHFFGDDYYQYQKRVSTGLPFIQGYKVEL
ncbi:protein-S-isoprenylcysteine O-methyltransferase isoform X1 [Zootermopsis nevadensis]|uniref:Protein-S-isoprenylcysteine O-methyltransferase n=1 Tax=Zootermopsis nevadensis TaxID=136037 RepID=A0A067R9D3_ZOONE|nr:protein-S-isoprenylcysteine O-methyltransferase isoform X1 [Zootermopsis nevadensis]KDR16214.1 Protein-S-isoprenylcysteine O-methyltransferase [Zootermopsis nevadensis]